jgi:hypothetical protein
MELDCECQATKRSPNPKLRYIAIQYPVCKYLGSCNGQGQREDGTLLVCQHDYLMELYRAAHCSMRRLTIARPFCIVYALFFLSEAACILARGDC